jgi:hypothetical protein
VGLLSKDGFYNTAFSNLEWTVGIIHPWVIHEILSGELSAGWTIRPSTPNPEPARAYPVRLSKFEDSEARG